MITGQDKNIDSNCQACEVDMLVPLAKTWHFQEVADRLSLTVDYVKKVVKYKKRKCEKIKVEFIDVVSTNINRKALNGNTK